MNKYWFRKRQGLKSKDLGWGWVPITWEGWTFIVGIVALAVISAFVLLGNNIANDVDPELATILIVLGTIIVLICVGALVSSKKMRP